MTVLRDYAAGLTQPTLAGGAAPYDEVVGPDGSLRPAWKGLAERAVALDPADLRRVDGDITGALADDGVTYGSGEEAGPWHLDPVPLVLDAATWTSLEVGLAQRAELLNAILVDLYGDQRLLSTGVLPPAVVLGHSGFTRVMARASAIDPRPLVISATDLGRDAAGEWRVVADRAQAPSGMGYAMENRRVISRVLPELYAEASLHRMEPYFWALRSALLQSADGDQADPRVVVLSPGSLSETAYDQAFLASTLGFPLVQGSDLVVRDGWVWMRGPGRKLERVDVVLRRVDASYSDPLELRGDSRLGVAGLLEAVRRGRVRVVNSIGSGVLENPALLPFMPAMCEALLGEPLRLPVVDTWWCGDPDSLDHVLSHLDDLHVRRLDQPDQPDPADPIVQSYDDGPQPVSPAVLRDRMLAEPHAWVGQARLPLSQAPTWGSAGRTRGVAVARPVLLRSFTLRYRSAYRPLVGGLASVLDPGTRHDPARRVVASKDVWVLKAAPGDPDQGLVDVAPMTAAPAAVVTGPRVLEDLYWAGRYAERAEDLLRLLLATQPLVEVSRVRPGTGWSALEVVLGVTGRLAGRRPGATAPPTPGDVDTELRSLLLDAGRSGTAAHALAGLRQALQGVRDQLSDDTWRAFGSTDRAMESLRATPYGHQVGDSAGRALTGLLSLHGVTANMLRDPGWHMLGVGRALERCLQLCHLLAGTTTVRRGLDVDRPVLTAVLTASESAVSHRRRYRGYVRPGGVLDLLVVDADNPRSMRFALTELGGHLAALPASTGSTRPERLLADLLEQVCEVEVPVLVAIGGVGRPNLETFLADTAAQLDRLARAVAETHLASGPAPRPLGGTP